MLMLSEEKKAKFFTNAAFNINKITGKQVEILKYLVENMEGEDNVIIGTVTEIGNKTNSSRKTVIDTLQLLEENGIIARRVGSLKFIEKES